METYNADKTIYRHSTRSSLVTILESKVPAGEDKQVKPILGEPLDSVPEDKIFTEYSSRNATQFQRPNENGFKTFKHQKDSQFKEVNESDNGAGVWTEMSEYGKPLNTTVKYTREGVHNNN